jgi:hypothetical protein
MPTFRRWYNRKKPTLQIRILNCVAVNGELSKKKLKKHLSANYPDVSDAVDALKNKEMIVHSSTNFKSSRPEQFYKITSNGFEAFIEENPSANDFWDAIIWFCKLKKTSIDNMSFKKYYDLFETKKIGNWSIHGGYFQIHFFGELLHEWMNDYRSGHWSTLSLEILECLALNRSITLDQIVEELRKAKKDKFKHDTWYGLPDYLEKKLTQKNIRNILDGYTLLPSQYYNYTYNSDADETMKRYLEYVKHLVIVSREQHNKTTYELSLFGVMLVLAVIRSVYLWNIKDDPASQPFLYSNLGLYEYFEKVAQNYKDKLPLIFGSWGLLKQVIGGDRLLDKGFDVIFCDDFRSDLMSIPVLEGGNKEIYENVRDLAYHINNKLLKIYEAGLATLRRYNDDEPNIKQKYSRLFENKLTEIKSFIIYADIRMFSEDLEEKKDKLQSGELQPKDLNIVSNHEISILEELFKEEITFLFYSHMTKVHDNPLLQFNRTHTLYLDHRMLSRSVQPRSNLLSILRKDDDIKAWFSKRLKDSIRHQKQTLDEMCNFYEQITAEKLDMEKILD